MPSLQVVGHRGAAGLAPENTLAAVEHRGPGFFRRSPQAFFMDNVQQASAGRRTPPDWFHQLHKRTETREAEHDRQSRAGYWSSPEGDADANNSDRQTFERIVTEMMGDFRSAGVTEPQARRQADLRK